MSRVCYNETAVPTTFITFDMFLKQIYSITFFDPLDVKIKKIVNFDHLHANKLATNFYLFKFV